MILVFICADDKADAISQNIIDAFELKLSPTFFYNDEDRNGGVYYGVDRQRQYHQSKSLVSVSIGIVSNVKPRRSPMWPRSENLVRN